MAGMLPTKNIVKQVKSIVRTVQRRLRSKNQLLMIRSFGKVFRDLADQGISAFRCMKAT
jgi:hypothetical protein